MDNDDHPYTPENAYGHAYEALADELRRRIEAGEYPPGSRLPSAGDLVRQEGVSRPVALQALGELRRAGLTSGNRGDGTRVRIPPPHRSIDMTVVDPVVAGVVARLAATGVVVDEVIGRLAARPPTRSEARELGTPAGQSIWVITREYRSGGKVVETSVRIERAEATDLVVQLPFED